MLLKLEEIKSNRDAICAQLGTTSATLRKRNKCAAAADKYSKATKADAIEIRWPGSLVRRLENVPGN